VRAKLVLQKIGRAARWRADFRSAFAPESAMATLSRGAWMEEKEKERKEKKRKIWSKSRSGAPNLTRPEADPAAGGLASVKGKRR